MQQNFYGPALLNPYGRSDPKVDQLLEAVTSSSRSGIDAANQALNEYLTNQVWGAALLTRLNTDLVAKSIQIPDTTVNTPTVDPIGPEAKYAFRSAG